MAVLLDRNARVLAVNAVGAYGRAQVQFAAQTGTNIVAHAAAGRGGSRVDGLPVFESVAEAVAATSANAALIYTPAMGARDAIVECADAGLRLATAAAEFVPLHDTLYAVAYARERSLWISGPNTVGIVTPGQAMLGAIPPGMTMPGRVGVIGRSGTLTMTVAATLTRAGIGQSTIVHVGGDALCGRNPHEWLQLFLADPETDAVLYVGEIGGTKEYSMLDLIGTATKPVLALIAGRHAPVGKRMGHAGALVGGERETAKAKMAALQEAGATIARSPAELADKTREMLQ
ncbi:succinyl-CoA synthetase alpha subunit [Rhodoligotrophos appendicifer]|uniref:succinate--CoA ligase subunit alpha n=1 Tax=Rhodoligotrophos appendicifer TaxID=987056 RepID=UPI00117F79B6|nr:succinate--CoA ligase subunit alpha [Rhodoligotrophos appendicifer]